MEPIINAAGGGAGQAPAAEPIKEATTRSFMADVIEASREVPVIVDFWAEWCGPCKQLGPVLEKVVRGAGGAVRMVKVNVDQNQALAQQLRIQSIPAVFAFFNGQPVDAFAGALPESQVQAFVDQVIVAAGGKAPDSPIDEALAHAEECLKTGDMATARAIFEQVLSLEPDTVAATVGLIRCLVAAGDIAAARTALDGMPSDAADGAGIAPGIATAIAAVRAAVELAEKSAAAGDIGELDARLAANAADHQARFDLALALFAKGEVERAIDQLLEIIRRDRQWADDGARKQLLQFFDAMGAGDPLTVAGRRKMSALLFS